MKRLVTICLFMGINCNISWANKLFLSSIYKDLTEKTDTIFIDLKNDPDFKFKNSLRWYQDSELALFGIKDNSGKLFIEPMFTQIESFIDGISIVTYDDLQGAINNRGEIVIPFQYEELQTSSEFMIPFYENGKWGYFNTLGEQVIEPTYEYVGGFYDGLSLASQNQLFGYINKKGKVVIPFQYDYASHFENGEAKVEIKFKAFTINKKGTKIAD